MTTPATKAYKFLTQRQKAILNEIQTSHLNRGMSPTVREMEANIGVSLASINYNVAKLEKWGYLERIPGAARSLRIIKDIPGKSRTLNHSVLTISINLLGSHDVMLAEAHAGVRQLQSLIDSLTPRGDV